MKLTEKELNEFPIGTKIYNGSGRKYMKVDNISIQWRELTEGFWISNEMVLNFKSIQKIEIPSYTEYIPPKHILDDKEKEYLSGVIKPWRKEIKYIGKKGSTRVKEWIRICLKDDTFTSLPLFKPETMYKGMELGREYTLDELGL